MFTKQTSLIIGSKHSPLKTRSTFRNASMMGLLSLIEPTSMDEALTGDEWNIAMQEELNQF